MWEYFIQEVFRKVCYWSVTFNVIWFSQRTTTTLAFSHSLGSILLFLQKLDNWRSQLTASGPRFLRSPLEISLDLELSWISEFWSLFPGLLGEIRLSYVSRCLCSSKSGGYHNPLIGCYTALAFRLLCLISRPPTVSLHVSCLFFTSKRSMVMCQWNYWQMWIFLQR